MNRALLSLLAAAATCAVGPLLADDPDGQYEPGRAVARISVLNGDVSVRRGDSGDVVAAAVNAPVTAEDRVLTSSSSRAEVQLDSANAVRIGPNSEIRFTALDLKSYQLQVAVGTATLRVLRPSQAQVELETPSVAVRALRQGIYRVDVREDGTTSVTVRSGEAEIASQRGSERLGPGQTMNARGPSSDPEFQIVQAIPPDGFDRWSDDRDRYMERSLSYQHVSPDIYGAEDLDQNGQWVNDPNYGSVWAPTNVPQGWAPYRDGRWVWEDYYGWTWVSYEPWGWAPYHYGRWFYGPAGWCWYPGALYGPHYWAPAYVGFFGWGGGAGLVSVGFGFGGVGWVPLAPFEVFHPWWGRGFYGGYRNGFYGNHTTIVNNINVVNVYRNAGVNGGVTGVNAGDFGRRGHFTALDRGQIQQASLVHGVLPISPDRASLRMSDRSVNGSFPQARAQNFASRMQAPRPEHIPFEQQQRGMQQIARTNFGSPNVPRNIAPGSAPGQGGQSSSPGESAGHGWSRFGEPIHGGTSSPTGVMPSQAPRSSGGPQAFQGARPETSAPRYNWAPRQNFGNADGGQQPVRINPPIVQQRAPNSEAPRNYTPSYQQGPRSFEGPRNSEPPRNYAPNYQQQAPRSSEAPRNFEGPRNFGGGGPARSAPNFGNRGSGGGEYHAGGGGGGRSGGGGNHGGHR